MSNWAKSKEEWKVACVMVCVHYTCHSNGGETITQDTIMYLILFPAKRKQNLVEFFFLTELFENPRSGSSPVPVKATFVSVLNYCATFVSMLNYCATFVSMLNYCATFVSMLN